MSLQPYMFFHNSRNASLEKEWKTLLKNIHIQKFCNSFFLWTVGRLPPPIFADMSIINTVLLWMRSRSGFYECLTSGKVFVTLVWSPLWGSWTWQLPSRSPRQSQRTARSASLLWPAGGRALRSSHGVELGGSCLVLLGAMKTCLNFSLLKWIRSIKKYSYVSGRAHKNSLFL